MWKLFLRLGTGAGVMKVLKWIWDHLGQAKEVYEQSKQERDDLRDEKALLMFLRRVAARESVNFDLKEFNGIGPHLDLKIWNVRSVDRNDYSFIIDFKPDPAVVDWCRRPTSNCYLRPKQIGVNFGLLQSLPNFAMISIWGRDADEIDQSEHPVTAIDIVEWMVNQENEFNLSYVRRDRQRIGQ